MNFVWKKYIDECLNSTQYCTLATVDETGVWSNPVYFAWDHQYNFYFISQLHSRHMQNIVRDPRVAVSIYPTDQDTYSDVFGIQLEGRAEILKEDEDIIRAREVYMKRRPPKDGETDYSTWLLTQITVEKMYYFDIRFFEEERQLVPLNKIWIKN